MEIKLIKNNKILIKYSILIFCLLKFNLCFIQRIKRANNKDTNNYPIKNFINKNYEQAKVFGNINILNYYYINLYIGKEKKKQSFLLDTGSGVTSIPCKPYCNQCGLHMNSYIYVDESQIINCNNEKCSLVESECNESNNYCSFKVHYNENSLIKGIYINELIQFLEDDKNKKNIIPIGCTIYEDNFFYTQKADGIIGLCNSDYNFINLLYKNKMIKNNIFSLCFGQKGGYANIGEIETKYHKENIHYIDINKKKYFYTFNINEIRINNNTISNKIYQANIDSGLTISNIPISISNKIIEYVNNICNKNMKVCGEYYIDKELDYCYKFNSSEELNYVLYNIWPNISFLINDYEYIWKPSQYLFQFIENEKVVGCFGFIKNRANIYNLGASWMIGHDIIFDNENSKIGFVEANCNQEDLSNNGEEDDEIPLYNDQKHFYKNNSDKKKFVLYIITIVILFFSIISLCFCIINLKRGKNCWFLIPKTNFIENEFIKDNNFDIIKDINEKKEKASYFIEMNTNNKYI